LHMQFALCNVVYSYTCTYAQYLLMLTVRRGMNNEL